MHKQLINDVFKEAEFGIKQAWFTKADVKRLLHIAIDSKQAEIDRLMLEFCPEEMSDAQMEEWYARQKPVTEDVYQQVCLSLGFPTNYPSP